MIRFILLFAFAIPCLTGCQKGGAYVPVSGTIYLDEKPLANTMVTFQPTASTGHDTGGVGSYAMTDDQGNYQLEAMTETPIPGALPAVHQVRIATPPPKGNEDSDAAATGKKKYRDPIPKRYNVESKLTYEVPAGGTKSADFKLTSHPTKDDGRN